MKRLSIGNIIESDTTTQDMIDDLIFELIRERKKRKITQVELSEATGISQVTISRLESLRSIPTLPILITLASALGLSLTLKREEHARNEN